MKFLDRVLLARADEQMERFEFKRYQHENRIPCLGGCGGWVTRGTCEACCRKAQNERRRIERAEFRELKARRVG